MTIQPNISIVVCTYNRADMLENALRTLLDLETDDLFTYEIVVVDNASTDNTSAVTNALVNQTDWPLRYVMESKQGIVPARNRGVHEATGEWIAFFDDDQLADPRWLVSLWILAHEKNTECVGGPVALHLPAGSTRELLPTVRMLLGESNWSSVPAMYDEKRCPGAGNMLIRKDWVLRIGAFDAAVGARGEDTDLFLRLLNAGGTGWYAPAAVVLHVMTPQRLEADYILRLANWMGGSVAEKEFGSRSWNEFFCRWFAKELRRWLWQMPQLLVAYLCRLPETLLEFRCQAAISRNYSRRGWEMLFPARTEKHPTAKMVTT
jgi:glycosyltransferase involved in cell wall biosynthesis